MDYSSEILLRGSIFRRTCGQARLVYQNGQSVRCDFELIQYQKGSIFAFCKVALDDVGVALQWGLVTLIDDNVAFEGETEDGFRVQLSEIIAVGSTIESTTGQPVEVGFVFIASQAHFISTRLASNVQDSNFFQLRFPLVNLQLPPVPPNEYSDPSGTSHTRSVLKLTLSGTTFYFEPAQNASATLNELQHTKGIAVTATAFSFFQNQGERITLESTLHNLNTVLTLLQGTRINRLGCDILTSANEVVESWWYDAVTRPYSDKTLLNRLLARDVKLRFGTQLWVRSVKTMFAEFSAKNSDWNLSVLIDAYIDAAAEGDFLELRGLKICGCMEILRARFLALQERVYLVPKEGFDTIFSKLQNRVSEALRELLPGITQETLQAMTSHLRGLNYFPFRRALRQLCKEVAYQATKPTGKETKVATDVGISAFIAIRNALVHYGHFAVPDEPQGDWTEERIDAVRWHQYQFIERVTGGILASLLGWMQIKPETKMPDAPDFWQE